MDINEETPIKDFIEEQVQSNANAFFGSETFRESLSLALSRQIRNSPTFQGIPVARFEVTAAADGGFDITAVLPD